MSAELRRRPAVLFAVALLGTHVVIALALAKLTPLASVGYLLLTTLGLLAFSVRRMRAAQRPPGSTCTCCTSTVHDPVEVR